MRKLLTIAGISLLSLGACKKDKKTGTPKDYLTAHDWMLNKIYYDGVEDTLEACTLDNYYTFLKNGDFIINEGTVKCYPGSPQTIIIQYSLSADQKQLTLSDSSFTEVYSINKIDNNVLDIQSDDGFGVSRITFKKR